MNCVTAEVVSRPRSWRKSRTPSALLSTSDRLGRVRARTPQSLGTKRAPARSSDRQVKDRKMKNGDSRSNWLRIERVQVLRNIRVAGAALRLRQARTRQPLPFGVGANGAGDFLRRHQWE